MFLAASRELLAFPALFYSNLFKSAHLVFAEVSYWAQRIGVSLLPLLDACQLQLPSRFCQCRRDAGDGPWKKQKTNIAVFHDAIKQHVFMFLCV